MSPTADQFSNTRAVLAAVRRAAAHLVPPPDMLPSVWAEKNVRIPVGNVIPGPINFDNAPYQRGMVDVIKEPGIRRADYMMGAQTGKTTVIQVITGYHIEHEPRSQILVQPTQGDVQTFLETKLRPMLDANPSISSKMAKQRGREGVNNSRIISYIGGWLMFSWAGSPKTLRGRSAPITQADEIDGMEATPEGDPVELLAQRAATFGDQAISIRSSTPTVKGASRIDTGFQEGDQRRFHVGCPDCHEPQYFKWENVTWQGRVSTSIGDYEEDIGQQHQPETAMYCCEHCGGLWNDGQRIAAVRNAERLGHGWKAAKPFKGHASFHGPEMMSTFRRLRDIVQSYLDKIAVDDMRSFVNVSLAEAYDGKGEKADPSALFARAQESAYSSGQVPAGGLYLTAGIDMQQDRLEVEVVAWGIGEESWSIDYTVLWGDPLQGDVWNDLDDYLDQIFPHESGLSLPISSSCLDTGGTQGYTQCAYDYARGKTGRKLFAIKGVAGWGRPIVEKPQRRQSGKNARKVDLFAVGVDEAKLTVMRRLANEKPGPGYSHFPNDRDEEYFKGLTCEKLVIRYVKGQPIREWHKPDRARNEPLDCRDYAYAAFKITQPSLKRLAIKLKVPEKKETGEWSKDVSDTAVKLVETLKEVKKVVKVKPAPAEPEKPQEEAETPPAQNGRIIRSKRVLQQRTRGKNWAKQW